MFLSLRELHWQMCSFIYSLTKEKSQFSRFILPQWAQTKIKFNRIFAPYQLKYGRKKNQNENDFWFERLNGMKLSIFFYFISFIHFPSIFFLFLCQWLWVAPKWWPNKLKRILYDSPIRSNSHDIMYFFSFTVLIVGFAIDGYFHS